MKNEIEQIDLSSQQGNSFKINVCENCTSYYTAQCYEW